jgi:uncharacterized protein (TIGR02246 family)
MKKRIVLVLALASLAVPGVLRAGQAEDEAAIRKFGTEFAAAWNKHDAKAMASFWEEDGDLINPSGRVAKGRAEVEKLFQDEHATAMAGTSYSTTLSSVRFLTPEIALADWEAVVTGMHQPDGSVSPPFKPHVFIVMGKKSGRWLAVAARPYHFLNPPPPAK